MRHLQEKRLRNEAEVRLGAAGGVDRTTRGLGEGARIDDELPSLVCYG